MIEGINDIINSGLLERYVEGDVSIEERLKVDMLKVDHREIKDRLQQIEIQLEQDHLKQSIIPPKGTKEAIIKRLGNDNLAATQHPIKKELEGFKSWLSIAASVLLSVGIVWFIMDNSLQEARASEEELTAKLMMLEKECNAKSLKYAFINDPYTKPVLLNNVNDQSYEAVVYWNENKQASYLRSVDLKKLKDDQIYQIWADVEGEMISIGTFLPGDDLIAIDYLPNATSLNITIEPKGGSMHPTLSTLTASNSI